MPTTYVRAVICVTSPDELSDEQAIRIARDAWHGRHAALASERRHATATVLVSEEIDADEMAQMEADIQGDRQQP